MSRLLSIPLVSTTAAILSLAVSPAGSVTLQVRPDHDNWTEDGFVGVQDHTANQAYGSTVGRQAYLKFDIGALASGLIIDSATLTMRTRNDFSGDAIADLYSVDDDSWDETTLEDSNEPPLGSVIATIDIEGTNTLAHPAGTSQLDIIDVKGWVTSNYSSNDFLISMGLVEVGSSITFFRGAEHADQSEHPWALLTVNATDITPVFTNVTVDSEVGFQFDSAPGADYQLQCSTNGTNWTSGNITVHGLGQTEVLFSPTGINTSKQYRIAVLP
jgi:hypothetical protein